MPDPDVEAVISDPEKAKPPVSDDEEVDVGLDLTGDRVPDLWLKLRGRWQLLVALFVAYGLGIVAGRYLLR